MQVNSATCNVFVLIIRVQGRAELNEFCLALSATRYHERELLPWYHIYLGIYPQESTRMTMHKLNRLMLIDPLAPYKRDSQRKSKPRFSYVTLILSIAFI